MTANALDLRNSGWRRVWFALILAGLFALIAGGVGVIVARSPPAFQQTGLGTVATLVIIFGGIFAGTLLFIAAMMAFMANRADDLYEQFRRGDVIADWTFPAQDWEAFLAKRQLRGKTSRLKATLACVAPIGFIGLVTVYNTVGSGARVVSILAVVAGSAALCWPVFRLMEYVAERRIARIRQQPRVLIAHTGIECGGELTQWNTAGTALVEISTADGNPLMLKVVTGTGKSIQALDTAMVVVDVLALVAGGDFITSGAGTKIRTELFIPIPDSDPAEGARIVAALLRPLPN